MDENDPSPTEAAGQNGATADENAYVEVEVDDEFIGTDAIRTKALSKIAANVTMPPGLVDSIVSQMPSVESLGLSASVQGILGNLSQTFTPEELGISDIIRSSRLTESVAAQLPTFQLPDVSRVLGDSVTANLSGILSAEALGISDIIRGARLTDSVAAQLAAQMPTFHLPDVSRVLRDSVSANLSGILSAEALGISSGWANGLVSSMLPKFDFSILKSISSWLPDFASLRLHLPTNWRGVNVDVDEIEEDVLQILAEGIPLAWVPDKRVIGLLLDAPDAQARRRIISNNHRGITRTCLALAGSLPLRGRPLFLADMVARAVHAFQDGHVESAQALATNVLDTLITGYSRVALGRSKGAMLNPEYSKKLSEERSWRLQLALGPSFTLMRGEHTVHERHNGFHRNATAHAVTSHQYSRINAVLAIMNATSVLTCFARDTEAFD